jgi:hypothetical protein
MADRDSNAYVVVAGLILGLSFPELANVFMVLVSKAKDASGTALWRLSLYSWLALALFISSQIVVLDFIASPYKVPTWFLGVCLIANYGTNFLTTIGISILFVYRLSLFYGKRSVTSILMTVFAVLVVVGKGIANYLGVKLGIDTVNLIYGLKFKSNPLYNEIPVVMSVAMSAEAVFATIGSILFLSFLVGRTGLKGLSTADSIHIKKEIFRIYLITIVNAITLFFGIWVAIDDNYVSHNGFCNFLLT